MGMTARFKCPLESWAESRHSALWPEEGDRQMPLGPTLLKSVVWAPEHNSAAAPPEGAGKRNQTASEAGWAEENLNSHHMLQLSSQGPKAGFHGNWTES